MSFSWKVISILDTNHQILALAAALEIFKKSFKVTLVGLALQEKKAHEQNSWTDGIFRECNA